MPTLRFSEVAQESIAELPKDQTLLRAVWRFLEQAANDPDRFTSPAPFPHRSDRLLCTFRVGDTAGQEWAFSVTFAVLGDVMLATTLTFNSTADYPTDEFEGEPPEA